MSSSSSKDPDAARVKRLRLANLGKTSFATQSAIAHILKECREDGVPDVSSRPSQYRARKGVINEHTPYGPLVSPLRLPLDVPDDVAVQHPMAMLHTACNECEPFAELMRDTLERFPVSHSNPWRIITYIDEIGPGDALKHDSRKAHCIYWSFLEFGPEILCHEEVWFAASIARTSVIEKLDAGTSHLMKLVLRKFFDPHGHNFERGGVTLKLHGDNGSSVFLFAKLAMFIADEKAIKEVMMCKGHAGIKLCMCCKNITSDKSRLHLGSALARPGSCINFDEWDLHTDGSVRNVLRRLSDAAPVMGQTEFETLEKILGWGHSPFNVLNDTDLNVDPISILMYDWMHIFFVTGLWNHETCDLLIALEKACNKRGHRDDWFLRLDRYLQKWVWPKWVPSCCTCFAGSHASSHRDAGHIKVSASEGLSLYPVIASFVSNYVLPKGLCEAECRSYLALCDVLDIVSNVAKCGATPNVLRTATFRHMELRQAAYGTSIWIPKNHYAGHLWYMLLRHGTLLSCYTHERHHRLAKKYAVSRKNTQSYELGVLEDVTLQQLKALKDPSFLGRDGLINAHVPSKRLSRAIVDTLAGYGTAFTGEITNAKSARVHNLRVYSGDVVLAVVNGELRACEVYLLVALNGIAHVCISPWDRDDPTPVPDRARWRVCDAPRLVPLTCVRASLIHTWTSTREHVITLLPVSYR
jgi:hypothetical protein